MIKIELPESLYKELSSEWIKKDYFIELMQLLSVDMVNDPNKSKDQHYEPLIRIYPNIEKAPEKQEQFLIIVQLLNAIAFVMDNKHDLLQKSIEQGIQRNLLKQLKIETQGH